MQSTSKKEEQFLVLRAQSGDKGALAALWDIITPKLFGYLINIIGDRNLAEDVLQTTWLKAINNLSAFQPRGIPISAWLFAIARNESRQHWRKSWREVPFELGKHDRPEDGQDKLKNKILADEVLALLHEDDCEILRLRYLADLSVDDIARILNLNFVAVRVRVHRALARARAALVSKTQ